jgi:hypothetical protein
MPEPLKHLIAIAKKAFGGYEPYPPTRLPVPSEATFRSLNQNTHVEAVWTRDRLPPQWTNIAVVCNLASTWSEVLAWGELLREFSIPLGIFAHADRYYIFPLQDGKAKEVPRDSLSTELDSLRDSLFTPRALAQLRAGQLSFADLEETITDQSFTLLFERRAELSSALKAAITEGLKAEVKADSDLATVRAKSEAVLMVAIAYLAARILEDKGRLGDSGIPTSNPARLIHEAWRSTDGFFEKVYNEKVGELSDRSMQEFAKHLGAGVSFSLVNHRDVGRFYEQSLFIFEQVLREILGEDFGFNLPLLELQQHFTPVPLAERMVDMLPLERLRPEERRIFDPAAGSGSLLLAATRRLAAMPDTPRGQDRAGYLEQQIRGNDKLSLARLVSKMRYCLQEAMNGSDPFPFPASFTSKDFWRLSSQNFVAKPRVVIANPPFAISKNVQMAVKFVDLILTWLDEGSQFAVILPQTFLIGSNAATVAARRKLARDCQILEVWQFPESVVGYSAHQAVTVILGIVGKPSRRTIKARAVISGSAVRDARERGFLGRSWLASLSPEGEDWSSTVAEPVTPTLPTVALGELCHVFRGVELLKEYPPIQSPPPPGVQHKRYWVLSWREPHSLLANPERVPAEQRFIRYEKRFLRRDCSKWSEYFDRPKLLIGRSINRASVEFLAPHLDKTGFCPSSDIFCIVPRELSDAKRKARIPTRFLESWLSLSYPDQLLWLLGIFTSAISHAMLLGQRSSRKLNIERLQQFKLPAQIDSEIINITNAIVSREEAREQSPNPNDLRIRLDSLVASAYGAPKFVLATTTGEPPEIVEWRHESRKRTSTVMGKVVEVLNDDQELKLYLDGMLDDEREGRLPLPAELPGWALDGTVFEANLSEDIDTFEQLAKRPWGLRAFRHTPRPYLSIEELEKRLSKKVG